PPYSEPAIISAATSFPASDAPVYPDETAWPPRQEPAVHRPVSRYAPVSPENDEQRPERSYPAIPPAFLRFCLLAVVVVLLLWGLWAGGSKLWKVATTAPAGEEGSQPPVATISTPPAALAPGESLPPRTPIPQPPIYLD
ncbi:MAG: hypothetical protein IJJ51_00560, partial [Kiritimatiellae bacterium]|nr:hypothetical protein [Kiritimatiellia bacterium]